MSENYTLTASLGTDVLQVELPYNGPEEAIESVRAYIRGWTRVEPSGPWALGRIELRDESGQLDCVLQHSIEP
jgi:hypothetical protein